MNRKQKELFLKQVSKVIFITGLPSAGKTTIALQLENQLTELGFFTKILDGDEVRAGLNSDLNYTLESREENIRRISEVAKMFVNCGIITIVCVVCPTNVLRNRAREIIGNEDFIEVYIDCPVEVCELRDVKGLYKKARIGEIKDFTGIHQLFERSDTADIVIQTHQSSIKDSVDILLEMVLKRIK